MESMIRQRMFFFGLKSTFIVILIALVIILVLVKGFNLVLFKKKSKKTDSGKPNPSPEKPVAKPIPPRKSERRKTETDIATEHDVATKESDDTADSESEQPDADVKEVTESCMLP